MLDASLYQFREETRKKNSKKGKEKKEYFPSPTTRPVIGPQSQIHEEKACSIPSV